MPLTERRQVDRFDLQAMGVPREFWGSTRERLPELVSEPIRNYMDNLHGPNGAFDLAAGLLLQGPRGTGKTAASVVVAKEARGWGHPTHFVRSDGLPEAFREVAGFDPEPDVARTVVRLREVDLLIIDDFRVEDLAVNKHWTPRKIEGLLQERASHGKITLISTQESLSELDTRTGIRQAMVGHLVVIEFDGIPDLRRRANETVESLTQKRNA